MSHIFNILHFPVGLRGPEFVHHSCRPRVCHGFDTHPNYFPYKPMTCHAFMIKKVPKFGLLHETIHFTVVYVHANVVLGKPPRGLSLYNSINGTAPKSTFQTTF